MVDCTIGKKLSKKKKRLIIQRLVAEFGRQDVSEQLKAANVLRYCDWFFK